MNAKILTVVVGLFMLVPVGYAADAKFGSCPSGTDCEEIPDDGGPFPPDAVTGHTVYASFVINDTNNRTLGLPTDFAAVAGYFEQINANIVAVQRECVVWFNGYNLDQRPDPDNFGWGAENAFPSDEDQPLPPGGVPNHDASYQDYDFDRDVENCVPYAAIDSGNETSTYAIVVEKGDCAPASGLPGSFRFRGHLDFVDPNHIYHEVQEYDYECAFTGPMGNPLGLGLGGDLDFFGFGYGSGGLVSNDLATLVGGPTVSELVKDMFPFGYTDRHNQNGCAVYDTPLDNAAPPGDLGYFDVGHKCNGSVQDLFTERLWMTEFHARMVDPTILQYYNFALQIDTCAGVNIYEVQGKDAMGGPKGAGAESDPQAAPGITQQLDLYHDIAYDFYYGSGLDAVLGGWPLFDVCTDGSSFSFDDTPRNRVVHSGPPAGAGDTEIMRGNSYDFDAGSETFGTHRTNCRSNFISWPYNTYPPGPPPVGDDCYPEDHKTALIDIYVYDDDPTGLWLVNSNGLTGLNAYVGPGFATGPNYPYS